MLSKNKECVESVDQRKRVVAIGLSAGAREREELVGRESVAAIRVEGELEHRFHLVPPKAMLFSLPLPSGFLVLHHEQLKRHGRPPSGSGVPR